jgi:hypothetical protein
MGDELPVLETVSSTESARLAFVGNRAPEITERDKNGDSMQMELADDEFPSVFARQMLRKALSGRQF